MYKGQFLELDYYYYYLYAPFLGHIYPLYFNPTSFDTMAQSPCIKSFCLYKLVVIVYTYLIYFHISYTRGAKQTFKSKYLSV